MWQQIREDGAHAARWNLGREIILGNIPGRADVQAGVLHSVGISKFQASRPNAGDQAENPEGGKKGSVRDTSQVHCGIRFTALCHGVRKPQRQHPEEPDLPAIARPIDLPSLSPFPVCLLLDVL